jgi:hypothetical protein
MNLKRSFAAFSVAALVACPAAATAKSGNGGSGKAPDKGAKHEGKKPKKPKKPKVQTYEFKGLVAAVGDGSVQVQVLHGNSRGKKFKGQTLTFDVSKAKVKVADVNKDGKRDLADVAVGDRVMVQAKVAGPVDVTQPVAARHLVDKGPVPPPSDDDEAKAPETTEPPAA